MSDHPKACVILIGNEILSGRTQDKNLNHIALRLLTVGIRVEECRVISDDEPTIVSTVNECRAKYDYVFTTGGIGPTHDDITSAAIAKAFGVKVYRNQEAEEKLRNRVKSNINEATLKMADVPEGCELIQNPVTAAPGFIMGNVFVMAGIPAVMHGMMESVLPLLRNGKQVHSESVYCDLAESKIAPGLHAIQETYPSLEIGSYPHWPISEYRLSLITRGADESQVLQAASEIKTLVVSLDGTLLDTLTQKV